jgi:hypothetical protein
MPKGAKKSAEEIVKSILEKQKINDPVNLP